MARIVVDADELVHLAAECRQDAADVRSLAVGLGGQVAQASLSLLAAYGIHVGDLLARLATIAGGPDGLLGLSTQLGIDADHLDEVRRSFESADDISVSSWPMGVNPFGPIFGPGGLAKFFEKITDFLSRDQPQAPGGVPTPQKSPTGSDPGHPGDPKFVLGPPTKPEIPKDNGFPYDPDASPGLDDYKNWVKWQTRLRGGDVIRPDLDDALTLFRHYTHGNGEPREVDFEEGYREDKQIRVAVDTEIASAQEWAEKIARDSGSTSFSMTGDATGAEAYTGNYPTETENWRKTLGGYQLWSSADVRVEGDRVTMTVTVHAEDHYNFNPGQEDIATGTPDAVFGRFAELGWAHPFDVHGELKRTVTWTLGEASPPSVTDQSAPECNPGREDREDGRGSSDGGRPVVPDNDRDTGSLRVQ